MNNSSKFRKDFRGYAKSVLPSSSLALMSYMSPSILEEREMHVTQMDVFSRLMMERIIYFGTEVNSDTANIAVSQLLYLDSISSEPIKIYINSPGGEIYSGNSVLDTMRTIKSKVATHCVGLAASFGAMILSCGQTGMRTATPLSRIMIHQPSGGAQGMASDIEITYHEIQKLKTELTEILAARCGKTYEEVEKKMDRDHWMKAHEALEFGIIDHIIPDPKAGWDK